MRTLAEKLSSYIFPFLSPHWQPSRCINTIQMNKAENNPCKFSSRLFGAIPYTMLNIPVKKAVKCAYLGRKASAIRGNECRNDKDSILERAYDMMHVDLK